MRYLTDLLSFIGGKVGQHEFYLAVIWARTSYRTIPLIGGENVTEEHNEDEGVREVVDPNRNAYLNISEKFSNEQIVVDFTLEPSKNLFLEGICQVYLSIGSNKALKRAAWQAETRNTLEIRFIKNHES